MANTITGVYQTVMNAMTQAAEALVFPCAAIERVFTEYKPLVAPDFGQTINVVIPGNRLANVSDWGVGDAVTADVTETTKALVFNKHPGDSILIRDFEQFNTPADLRKLFVDASLKGIREYINNAICALFTTGNFPNYSAISTTGSKVTVAQFLPAVSTLLDNRVPAQNNVGDMSLLLASVPYTKILDPTAGTNPEWTQAQIAGMQAAEEARRIGMLPTAFGMSIGCEPQMPIAGTSPSRTFTGVYMHRYAVALASRPLPKPDSPVVMVGYVPFAGVMLRVMVGYNQRNLGWLVTIDAGYALGVIRPEMGIIFSTAE